MDKKIEEQLLNTKTLNEFRKIVIDNGILTTDKLSDRALKHHQQLGSGHSAEQPTDPRKK